jgi:hypothetical protein
VYRHIPEGQSRMQDLPLQTFRQRLRLAYPLAILEEANGVEVRAILFKVQQNRNYIVSAKAKT